MLSEPQAFAQLKLENGSIAQVLRIVRERQDGTARVEVKILKPKTGSYHQKGDQGLFIEVFMKQLTQVSLGGPVDDDFWLSDDFINAVGKESA